MIVTAKLKKPWKSPRGKIYPSGSIFKLARRIPECSRTIYDFVAPGIGSGWVVFSDEIFRKLTEEEVYLRKIRKKITEEHLSKIKSPFL